MKIHAGIESLIHKQLNDWIIPELNNLYVSLEKVFSLYYVKQSINKKDYTRDLNTIISDFENVTEERFGFRVVLRPSTTFAIMPIFNIDTLKSEIYNVNSFNKDIKHSMQQLKHFKKELSQGSSIEIDLEHAVVKGLNPNIYFPLFIDKNIITEERFTVSNFITIMLHEIGHVFTLLEMYTNTNRAIVTIADNLITHNDVNRIIKDMKISIDIKESNRNKVIKVYESFTNGIGNVLLATGRFEDNTDVEFEADSFVAKFGYGGELVKTLNMLIGAKNTKPSFLLTLGVIYMMITAFINLILLTLSINPVSIFLIVGTFIVVDLILRIVNSLGTVTNRNPTGGEHGDILTRYKRTRTAVLSMLRNEVLDKTEIKSLIKQVEIIDDEIKILDKSLLNTFLGSLLHNSLGVNHNLQDQLATLIDNTINNDLHLMSAKFVAGLEAKDFMDDVSVVYTEFWTDNMYYGPLLKIKKNVKLLNVALVNYGIEIRYGKTDKIMGVKTKEIITIGYGISGFSFIPKEVNAESTVVTITLESEKVLWLLENPFVKVYNIDIVQVTDVKHMYIMEIEYLSSIGTDKSINKMVNKIHKILGDNHAQYGITDFNTEIDLLLKAKFPDEVIEQFSLLKSIITKSKFKPRLDLHNGNFGLNGDKKIVLLDPVYNKINLATKQSNYIGLDLTKLSKKE